MTSTSVPNLVTSLLSSLSNISLDDIKTTETTENVKKTHIRYDFYSLGDAKSFLTSDEDIVFMKSVFPVMFSFEPTRMKFCVFIKWNKNTMNSPIGTRNCFNFFESLSMIKTENEFLYLLQEDSEQIKRRILESINRSPLYPIEEYSGLRLTPKRKRDESVVHV
jgi:hypothetical protein